MFKTLLNIFRVPELRNKVLFTLFLLAIYRVGYHVPLPGVDQEKFAERANPGLVDLRRAQQAQSDAAARSTELEQAFQAAQQAAAAAPDDTARQTALDSARAEADQARRDAETAQADLARAEQDFERRRQEGGNTAAARLAQYVSIFSGGDLSQSTIFGLGVMPYISASIIFQLLVTVVPTLEKLQKEGETGRRKIQEWTRYATVPLAVVQAIFWVGYMHNPGGAPLVQSTFAHTLTFWIMSVTALTAGCIFLMWLGEQIDEYGLGNGISLIILAGIVARMPAAIGELIALLNLSGAPDPVKIMTPGKVLVVLLSFVAVTAVSILMTQAQRRIPIQQAKHTRGRRVYGGQRQFLPLRVNHGGVMPIIFAQSLMLFPGVFLGWLDGAVNPAGVATNVFGGIIQFFNVEFGRGGFLYILTEVGLIFFFAYFWTTVQFRPVEVANQLRDYGSFIPGLRPGKRTADYLEKVMTRITYVGAAFLCLLAVVPTTVAVGMNIPFTITAFLGGTGLLIVVSVALDMVQRIEANLLMRDYGGFLSGPGQKGKRIKGRQY